MVLVGPLVMPVGLSPYAKDVYSKVNLRPGLASDCLPQRGDERRQPDVAQHDGLVAAKSYRRAADVSSGCVDVHQYGPARNGS
jgi:hypothetical protein